MLEKIKNKIEDLIEKDSRKIYEASFSFLAVTPLEYPELMGVIHNAPARDNIQIHLEAENEELFTINDRTQENDYQKFIGELLEDERVSVKIEINKSIKDHHFSVYCFEQFAKDLVSLPIEEALNAFSLLLNESAGHIIFELYDSKKIFYTKTMFFTSPGNYEINTEFCREDRLQECREISYFYNQDAYELLPDDFKIIVGYEENPVAELFKKLETVLSLCMLASNSSIQQGNLRLQIMGQRSVEFTYDLKEVEGTSVLYKVYDWIYSGGNSIDKALIARNIICLHCKYEPLQHLDANVLAAIQSNYNLYLKENVTQYLELKNKVAEFISGIVSKTGEYATEILDKFKTNLIAIFGFLFTVIIANIVSDQPLTNIFTQDITAILEFVLAGSLGYLFISYKQSKYQTKKVYDSYIELKKSYVQILTDDDIKECFQDDKIMLDMEKTINKSQKIYLMIWICFLVILFIGLEAISDSPIVYPHLKNIAESVSALF